MTVANRSIIQMYKPRIEQKAFCDCNNCDCPKDISIGVLGGGRLDARLVIVGEAPGSEERISHQAFIGRSGKLLWSVLKKHGIEREHVYVTNALLCQTHPTKGITPKSLRACAPRLEDELLSLTDKRVILCLGASAATSIRGEKAAITSLSGLVEWSEKYGCWVAYAYHPAAVLRADDLYGDLLWAVDRATQALNPGFDPSKEPEIEYQVIDTPEEAISVLCELVSTQSSKPQPVIFDLETSGLDPLTDSILEIGMRWGERQPIIFPMKAFNPNTVRVLLKQLCEDKNLRWVGHNAKFDVEFMRTSFGFAPVIGGDTMLMSYCLDERTGGGGGGFHDLKRLARRWCGAPEWEKEVDLLLKETGSMSDVDPTVRRKYQAYDLEYTWRLYGVLQTQLLKEPPSRHGWPTPWRTYNDLLLPAANMLVDVELRGIKVDTGRLVSMKDDYLKLLERERLRARTLAGDIVDDNFNPNSTQQVGRVLYSPKSEGGLGYPYRSSTAKDAMFELQRQDVVDGKQPCEFIESVLNYRSVLHTITTYIEGIAKRLGPDGRIRTNLLLHGTTSGRLSSRNPNLQNLPGDSSIRELFIPNDGRLIANADYKQLEVRVLAFYADDARLVEALQASDFHWAVCRACFPDIVDGMTAWKHDLKALEEIANAWSVFSELARAQSHENERTNDPEELFARMKKRLRIQAKKVTFGVMYGEGALSLSLPGRGMGVPIRDAAGFITNWKARYPVAAEWLDDQAEQAIKFRWVESASGRRRHFPATGFAPTSPNEAMNHPIQALASDICLAAMIRLNQELPAMGYGDVLLSVHDSILFELETETLEAAKEHIKQTMRGVLTNDVITFDIDIAVANNWGQCK